MLLLAMLAWLVAATHSASASTARVDELIASPAATANACSWETRRCRCTRRHPGGRLRALVVSPTLLLALLALLLSSL
jgi:predicted transglutaminase-like cysteine proteinase